PPAGLARSRADARWAEERPRRRPAALREAAPRPSAGAAGTAASAFRSASRRPVPWSRPRVARGCGHARRGAPAEEVVEPLKVRSTERRRPAPRRHDDDASPRAREREVWEREQPSGGRPARVPDARPGGPGASLRRPRLCRRWSAGGVPRLRLKAAEFAEVAP